MRDWVNDRHARSTRGAVLGLRRQFLFLAGAALLMASCATGPTVTTSQHPSTFLKGFSVGGFLALANADPAAPRCANAPAQLSSTASSLGGAASGMTLAGLVIECADAGGQPTLANALAAGLQAELKRLNATVSLTGSSNGIPDEWQYTSSGFSGDISILILPGADGRDWVVLRIVEPY